MLWRYAIGDAAGKADRDREGEARTKHSWPFRACVEMGW
jgi:hypothetical protein